MTDHTNRPDPGADDAHNLMPGWLAATVPPLYSQEGVETPLVRVKLFTPDAQWTWFVLEYDPAERLCFGLVCGQVDELGYFSLDELRAVHGPLGLRIEQDLWWRPAPLSHVRRGQVR